uniref:HEAT repeat-containing protein 6 n=1 Tax=Stomoxys calcitrans TaxID=35570 RepID=A0A1I8PGI2_STOCA
MKGKNQNKPKNTSQETGETMDLVLEHLLCCRQGNKDLVEISKLIQHVDKYGCENRSQQFRIVDEIIQLLANDLNALLPDESVSVVICMTHLWEQNKLPTLNETQFDVVLQLLRKNLEECQKPETLIKILNTLCGLFAKHPMNVDRYFIDIIGSGNNGLLQYVAWESSIDVLVNAVRCIDICLGILCCSPLSQEQEQVCDDILKKFLNLFFNASESRPKIDSDMLPVFALHTLQAIQRIISLNPELVKQNVSELLGFARSYLHFGLDNIKEFPIMPQKVYMSQQALYDSAEDFENSMSSEKTRNCGGKTPKTRKPRLKSNTAERNVTSGSPERKVTLLSMDIRTSDSEASELENSGNRVLFERNRMAKIRLASIAIIEAIVKTLERRYVYGYWHVLFPSGTAAESPDNLLYIAQHDPNMRCRCSALQVCAQLLYGSKGFLCQAEINTKRCPVTFIPFSVNLGFTVVAIYQALSTILTRESSLPVLTQSLKCLAVLVQATPFQKFDKGFVNGFVKHVKPLIYHRDAAIQVSSLMVLEFLVPSAEATPEIAEALGLPQPQSGRQTAKNNTHALGEEELDIINDEEFVESDAEEEVLKKPKEEKPPSADSEKRTSNDNSWLLLRVLFNLKDHDSLIVPQSVRIESIQVLIAMSSHFAMLKSHLPEVSAALQHVIANTLPEVRLYAARCIDSCAFQISRYVLENGLATSSLETKSFGKFWTDILPIIMQHIRRDSEETSTVRITLCDALSNIGVVMFENCSHSLQLALLSFLSGVSSDSSEEPILRAAAVRALAVYVLYPSLRSDFVFVENTADLALRLVTDANLLVRIKTFWALGNISDALVGKSIDSKDNQERVSDELLYRMIKASTMACSDNDKVRCNAVRTLGNLLRLLRKEHLQLENTHLNWRELFERAICKLSDCIRSSGNAKVKWNSCYAISNVMRNPVIFTITELIDWQSTLYPALCHVIVHHANFKVRINATSAITNIAERQHFGNYFEKFWSSILEAIEQSHNLDNFHEYNHRDNLQEQLCLALTHLLRCSEQEDWPMLKRHLALKVETIRSTWKRVVLRMVPEKAAPLLSCSLVLAERAKTKQQHNLGPEQKSANDYLCETLALE